MGSLRFEGERGDREPGAGLSLRRRCRATRTGHRPPPRPGSGLAMPVGPLLVFSPHLDDAVLSLGNLIAAHPGSIVVTVLAGMPPDEIARRPNGTRAAGSPAPAKRCVRDGQRTRPRSPSSARPAIHLEFLDRQYGDADRSSITARDRAAHRGASRHEVYGPLGLIHPDHILVSDAFVDAVSRRWPPTCHLYADIPYYARAGSLERRLSRTRTTRRHDRRLWRGDRTSDRRQGARSCRVRVADAARSATMPLDLPELTAAVRCTSRR